MTAGDGEPGAGRDLFSYRPIGIVRSPHAEPRATPFQPSFARGCTGTVEIDSSYEAGLQLLAKRFGRRCLPLHVGRRLRFD